MTLIFGQHSDEGLGCLTKGLIPNRHRRKAVRGLPHIRDHDWWPAPFPSFSSLQRPERPAANGRCRRFPPLTRAIATALARPSRKRTPTFLPQSNIAGRCREEDHPGPCPPTWRPALLSRSEEHTSELQSLRHLVCR